MFRFRNVSGCLLLAAAALFWACKLTNKGTEIPNEVTGSLRLADGDPAPDAEVALIPVNYAPGDTTTASIQKVKTNSKGKYSFHKVPDGQYNVVGRKSRSGTDSGSGDSLFCFSDSIPISGGQELPPDTLREPGSLTGTVQLQPRDDPRTATVQVLGTEYYTNVDAQGMFTFSFLAQGSYKLRVATILPLYVPLFKDVAVATGQNDTLPEPLVPFYSGIPVVTGLKVAAQTNGSVLLSWNKTTYTNLRAYVIYRDSASALMAGNLITTTMDTTFTDTLYSAYKQEPKAGQYAFTDATPHLLSYRVRIINLSDEMGPNFGSVSITPPPAYLQNSSGRWHLAAAHAPFSARGNQALVVFKNKLWLIGGLTGTNTITDVWSSSDGLSWQKIRDSLPFSYFHVESYGYGLRVAVFHDTLWLIGNRDTTENTGVVHSKNFLWKSGDGINWLRVSDNFLPFAAIQSLDSSRTENAFMEFQNKLWVIGGTSYPYYNGSYQPYTVWQAFSSPDGLNWSRTPITMPATGTNCCLDEVIGQAYLASLWNGNLWMAGGATNSTVWKSPDGINWSPVSANPPFQYRSNFSLTTHAGELWLIGGYVHAGVRTLYASQEVWKSTDGIAWQLVDVLPPFGLRHDHAAVSFLGRLWVIGGSNGDDFGPFLVNDVWYYE